MFRCLANFDSTWSTKICRQGLPVVPAGWCYSHTSNESLALLQQRLPDRLISAVFTRSGRRIHLNCTPQISNLWGYHKNRLYNSNPQTIPDPKLIITAATQATPREEYGKVIENFVRRIQCTLQHRVAHLEHIFECQ